MADPAIQCKALSKRYGETLGIANLDLDVWPGEIFGFLGPNGAGKTTTLRLLLGLIHPSSGKASVYGLDVASRGRHIRERVGYLPGELALYEHLDGLELLRYLGSLRGGLDEAYALHLARRLNAELRRPIRTLSHGNRQKIGLIQAFAHRPDLLILDEPTLGLDPLVRQEVYALLREFKTSGRTVFFSSHVVSEVEQVCDRVAMVRAARLFVVEGVNALRHRALRDIRVQFAEHPPRQRFERVQGLENLRIDGPVLSCQVRGTVSELLQALAEYEVIDLVSQEPSLEETFLSYYGAVPRTERPHD